MSIMVILIMAMIGMMIGADEQQRDGDDRAGHDYHRHCRHQQQIGRYPSPSPESVASGFPATGTREPPFVTMSILG
jgi:hypothetical protein